jgi:electron transfer flavoprotein alpha subunit
MGNKVLVFLEQRNGEIKKSSLQAYKAGEELAEYFGAEISAVTIGNEIKDLENVGNFGIKTVYHIKHPDLALYSSSGYSKELAKLAEEIGANILVFSNTAMGKDLAPRLAAKWDAGIAMDCIAFTKENDQVIATRPVYAGKALIDVIVKSEKKIFTVRPNVFQVGEAANATATIETREAEAPDLSVKVTELKTNEGKLDVAEADIIVSGGRGMKGPENFKMIEELADLLGGAVGASRAVVDAGWRPHSEQVGQTGKTVSPNLYIALAISGAIQHLAGMRSSKYIVAVNKDKDAPIFQVADYGIVGDVFEVLPAIIEEVKKIKS